jgi:hypothetical protein
MSPFEFDAESAEIAVGTHSVSIVEAVAGTNSKGNDNLRVVYEAGDGSQLADWLVKLPQSRWVWQRLWLACDLEFPLAGGTVDEKDLIGHRVTIVVEDDTYNDQTRPKVKDVRPPLSPDLPYDEPGLADAMAGETAAENDGGVPF